MFTIAPAAPADVAEAADVLAEAFKDDAATLAITGLGRPSVPQLAALFRPLVSSGPLRHGRVDLARRERDGAILGVALWEPPGRVSSVAHVTHQARELPAFLRALGVRGMVRAARNQALLASHRPTEPHWFLAMIGVGDGARGSGVGSALLASRLAAVDAAGSPAYLESSTEHNRRLYARHGFETLSIITAVEGARPAAMWRPACRAGQGRPEV